MEVEGPVPSTSKIFGGGGSRTLHLQYPQPPKFLEVEGPVPSTSSTLHLRNFWRWRVPYPPPPVPSTSVFWREEPGGVMFGGGGSSTTFTKPSVFRREEPGGVMFGGGGSSTLHLQYPPPPKFLGGNLTSVSSLCVSSAIKTYAYCYKNRRVSRAL